MKCPRCQHDIPSDAKFCADCGTPVDGNAPIEKSYADLKTEIEELRRSLGEALEQQTATAEILRVISSCLTNLQPVLKTIATNAAQVCGAYDAQVLLREGDFVRIVAHHGPIEAWSGDERPLDRGLASGRAILDRGPVHVHDVLAGEALDLSVSRAAAERHGFRTLLAVPLLREGDAIGSLTIRRREVQPFTDKQIELLKTFADQAVIAIENVRLLTELRESLEQQTATSEILRVIARSPTDVQPVFNAIVESATRLCAASVGHLFQFDGELLSLVAQHNSTPAMDEAIQRFYPMRPSRGQVSGRAILNRAVVHIPDVFSDPEYQPEVAATVGWRSRIGIPLLREGNPIGVIVINRTEPGLFADSHIELLQTFADQAVIAIENVRLFTELQEKNRALTQAHTQVSEALERQTATSEILGVISSSPTDVQPVFDSLVASAARLCGANDILLLIREGDVLRPAAGVGAFWGSLATDFRVPLVRGSVAARSVIDGTTLHIPDLAVVSEADFSLGRDLQRRFGHRTVLAVPLFREGVALGTIFAMRFEVRPFADQQIALLKTFADQAVIAIENVRLFNETKEALERQTATAEILRIISTSPTDLQPVLDAVAENAAQVCGANDAHVFRVEGNMARRVAHYGNVPILPPSDSRPLQRDTLVGRAIVDRCAIHIPDVVPLLDTEYPGSKSTAGATGARTILVTPLVREGTAIGAILIRRLEVRPFSGKQVALLQTFADQAVIAIENVRLFKELQEKNRALTQAHAQVTEALEQQTATSEILRTISGSPTDIQPTFETIASSATRLCEAINSLVIRFDGQRMHLAAYDNVHPDRLAALRQLYPRVPDRGILAGRAILTRAVVQVEDVTRDPEYTLPIQTTVGFRSVVAVPMLREGAAIGAIVVARDHVAPFSAAQVELLKTFADQAVIAIENVHLFQELQTRTQDLTRSVGELRALSEVSRAVSSTLDLGTVLETIVSRAVELSGSDQGIVYEFDEGSQIFHARATHRVTPEHLQTVRAVPIKLGEGAIGRAGVIREPVQVVDIHDESQPVAPQVRELLVHEGMRSLLAVPLVREQRLLGGLVILRRERGAFSTEVVAILQTFATQSVLAIQNARLFRELADKSHQLEIASQHKSEFLANMSHELRTPLNAIIGFSEVLSERMFGDLNEKQDEYLKDIHASGQHLLSLINDILDLSKIEAGKMELELSIFDLPMTIDNALMLIRERAARRSIALNTAVDERVGQVQGDERKIRQVLLNLLSNAIKFTPEGGRIHVEARLVNESIEVSVTDTGVGIAAEDQEAVFEEFRQVGTAEKKVEGTGLGLALSRKFIELHGGKIWVESQVGNGSTFTFTVPVRRGE